MPDAMVGVMGGPTKQEAREIVRELTDHDDEMLALVRRPDSVTPRQHEAWEAVTGSGFIYSWWRDVRYSEGADWETPGTLTVTVDDPDGYDAGDHVLEDKLTRSFTAGDLLDAYDAMPHKTHCDGCDLITDPDACSEAILQWAFFGEVVYG